MHTSVSTFGSHNGDRRRRKSQPVRAQRRIYLTIPGNSKLDIFDLGDVPTFMAFCQI